MKNKAKFVTEITAIDPDSKLPVKISLFKHENGGMFGIDSSYLDQCFDDDKDVVVPDPFGNREHITDTDNPDEPIEVILTGI
jgi:hypothetical protein